MKKCSGKTSADPIRGKEKNPANHGLLTGWRHWSLRKSLQAIYIWEMLAKLHMLSLFFIMRNGNESIWLWLLAWMKCFMYHTIYFSYFSIITLFWDYTGWHRVPGGVWRSSTHTHVYTYTRSHHTRTNTLIAQTVQEYPFIVTITTYW